MAAWTTVPANFSDHCYATKAGVALHLRVWPSPVAPATDGPWLLYAHGGGFVLGSHRLPQPFVFPAFLDRGYHVVSFGYRLVPHADLAAILDDTRDALAWCAAHLPTLLPGVDVARYVAAGDSAGGMLATMVPFLAAAAPSSAQLPPPRAVVSLYGCVDVADPHFDPGRGASMLPPSGRVDAAEVERFIAAAARDAGAALGETPVVILRHVDDDAVRAQVDAFNAAARAALPWTRRELVQSECLVHLGTTGRSMRALVRQQVDGEDDAAWRQRARAATTLGLLANAATYPPTFFLHGQADVSVPVEQSMGMARRLRDMGVAVGEVYPPGKGHLFDSVFSSRDVPGYDDCIAPMEAFVDEHVRD